MNPVWKWAVIKPLNGLRNSNEFKHEHLKPELSASPDRTMQKHAWNHNTCRLRRSEAAWSVLCACSCSGFILMCGFFPATPLLLTRSCQLVNYLAVRNGCNSWKILSHPG